MKPRSRTLLLTKETLKFLSQRDLETVVGGGGNTTVETNTCPPPTADTCGPDCDYPPNF